MKAHEAAEDLRGREVSLSYDCTRGTAKIEYGRVYEDEAEADFMGDPLPVGDPNGYIFSGVTLFRSSNSDSSCVGLVESADLDERRFDVVVSGPLGATVSFQFDTVVQTKTE